MIRVYYTFYEKESVENGKIRGLEHRTGRGLLCRGLKELFGMDTDTDSVDGLLAKEKNGKPYIKDRPDIHFNISHCSGLVVCAFADQPVGIDAEEIKPVRDPLIRRVLHEKEIQVLSRYGEIAEKKPSASFCSKTGIDPGKNEEGTRSREFLQLFFRYWTLKESWLKQDGSGLTREPREICFFVDPDDWTMPVRTSEAGRVCLQRKLCREPGDSKECIVSVCVPKSPRNESDSDIQWIEVLYECPE